VSPARALDRPLSISGAVRVTPASTPTVCCPIHGQADPFSDPQADLRVVRQFVDARRAGCEQVFEIVNTLVSGTLASGAVFYLGHDALAS
jgi:hypothetical protein